jgi:hypothetical protein
MIVKNLQEENEELKAVLKLLYKDLLMRAETEEDGCKVVPVGSSVWIKLKEAINEK